MEVVREVVAVCVHGRVGVGGEGVVVVVHAVAVAVRDHVASILLVHV